MRKNRLSFRLCRKILSIVILLSFLKSPAFGEPPTVPPPNSSENETRFYSDLEIELLIDEISEAALEAIEQAEAEAARAAALAAVEREAGALREAERWRLEAETARKNGIRNMIITGLACLLGGFVAGIAINR